MKSEIQQRFEEASRYDATMAKVFPGYEQLPLILLSHLRTCLGAGARVLDVGCGTGSMLARFAANQSDWSFVGVDPAEPMLEIARARMDGAGAAERVALVVGTVDALPDEPAFDAATAVLVEHLLPDDGAKLQFLEGIWRRLVPGGWIFLAGLHGDLESGRARQALEAWLEFVSLQGLPPAVRETVRRRATVEDSLVSETRLLQLLTEARFVDVDRIYQVCLLGAWAARKPR
ncbi:MAG: class I SAM-dependent methyltransferase [Thermoanaerobaculia bacterium]